VIKGVFVFYNGMVAVTDHNGQQVYDLQGRWEEKKEAILKAAPEKARPDIERLVPGDSWEAIG